MDSFGRHWFLILVVAFALTALFGGTARAEEPEEPRWKARLELSYVTTSGNTDTEAFSGKLAAKKEGRPNRYYLTASSLVASADGKETSNRISVDVRWERALKERAFVFLTAGYLRDRFSGYDYRLYGGPGVGYEFIKTERQKLKGLLSILYHYDKFSEGGGGSEEYVGGTARALYELMILDNVTFTEDLKYEVSFEDADRYFVDSESALAVKVNARVSLGLSYLVNYQNELPSSDLDHTDTKLLTTVIIDI